MYGRPSITHYRGFRVAFYSQECGLMSAFWEYRELQFNNLAKRSDIRTYLTSLAEVERWELDRVRISNDGRRWIRLRRKTYIVQRTA